MLQVSGLSVEVGGRLVVDGASFTIMPKDKVGIVGRNGAGKTSMFKVLGGAAEPAGGSIVRKGGFGYLPQDPRIEGAHDDRTAVRHILSGRGIDDALMRIEKLRIAMEETPSDRAVARYSRAVEEFQISGGYAAESEARSLAAGLGLAPDRLDLPIGVLSGGERRRVELSRILFAGSDVLLLDEPTNHLDIDAKAWLLGFLRQYRGALLVISHDLDLLDEAITRVLHLDRPTEHATGEVVEYRGRTASTSRRVGATRSCRPSEQQRRPRRSTGSRPSWIDSGPRRRRRRWRTASKSASLGSSPTRSTPRPRARRSPSSFPILPPRVAPSCSPTISPSPMGDRRSSKTSRSTSVAANGCSCSA
ncbi:MAG: ATP-binding cassette domain-containing protein [Ilumatobacteraceae bacterium]